MKTTGHIPTWAALGPSQPSNGLGSPKKVPKKKPKKAPQKGSLLLLIKAMV